MGLDKMRIRLLAAVMAVTLVLAGLGGWAVWSNHKAHAKAIAAAQAPAKKAEKGRRGAAKAPSTAADRDALKATAIAWARAAHEWGTDPAAVAAVGSGSDTSALTGLRPSKPDKSAFDALYSGGGETGPDTPSPYCTPTRMSACDSQPTMWDYWYANEYLMGARFVSDPTADVLPDGRVKVKGALRTVLWTDGETEASTQGADGSAWWAFAPAYAIHGIDETLTIEDGKVSGVDGSSDRWLVSPFLSDWNKNPCWDADSQPGYMQGDVPMRGDAPKGLLPDRDTSIARLKPATDLTSGAWAPIAAPPADTDQCGSGCDLSLH